MPIVHDLSPVGLRLEVSPGSRRKGGRPKKGSHANVFEVWFFYDAVTGRALGSWVSGTGSLYRGRGVCEPCDDAGQAVVMFAECVTKWSRTR